MKNQQCANKNTNAGKIIKPELRRSEMMYRILSLQLILVAFIAVFMMPMTVVAGGDASSKNTQAISAEKSVEGTLTAMESYGHILIRPDVGNLARLRLRPNAVIIRNGEPAKMADLRIGDKVQAKYDSKNWVSELHANGT
jgi:hypothetical protein